MAAPPFRRVVWLFALLASGACREGSEQGVGFLPVFPSLAGTLGCEPVTVPLGTPTLVFTSAGFGEMSQIAVASGAGDEIFYWTDGAGNVHELTVPAGGAGVDRVLLSAATIASDYLAPGIPGPAVLSGIAVIDAQRLVVAEHASNTLLIVRRDIDEQIDGGFGLKLAGGGFSSGEGDELSFRFAEPVPLFVDATGTIFVGDTGNHALRLVVPSTIPAGTTVAGNGAPGSGSGAAPLPRFDTPSGIAASCSGELLLVESGAASVAGQRLVSLQLREALFGGIEGSSLVLAGNGAKGTLGGIDTAAGLSSPMGLSSTADGFVFWVDADGNGVGDPILRRYDFATGVSDCPMFVDCATAVNDPSLFTGERFYTVIGPSGALYVLGVQGGAGTLWRVGT